MRIVLVLLLPMLAACADRPPSALQTTHPAGKAVPCVQISQIRSTRVLDDQTIDFELRNGTVLRNRLPYRCPALGFERAFSYATSINQLCNVDIVAVVVQGGGSPIGASCGLGMFVPVRPGPDPEAR